MQPASPFAWSSTLVSSRLLYNAPQTIPVLYLYLNPKYTVSLPPTVLTYSDLRPARLRAAGSRRQLLPELGLLAHAAHYCMT